MAATLYTFSWGQHRLDAVSYQERRGRDLLELLPASGPGGEVIDSGPARRQLQATLQWLPTREDPSKLDDRREFLASIGAGEALLLIHPLEGGVYLARVGEHTEAIDGATNAVTDNVTFVEDRQSDFGPQPVGAGVEPTAGSQSVVIAASQANDALASLGLESSEPAAAEALAKEWSTRSSETAAVVDARRVATERDQRLDAINAEIERLELAQRNDRHAVYQSFIALAAALRRAASAATRATAVTRRMTIGVPIGLRVLVASLDPAHAAALYTGIRAINRIDTPLLIPAGTELEIPIL